MTAFAGRVASGSAGDFESGLLEGRMLSTSSSCDSSPLLMPLRVTVVVVVVTVRFVAKWVAPAAAALISAALASTSLAHAICDDGDASLVTKAIGRNGSACL